MGRDDGQLLERETELSVVGAALESASAGSGRLVVIEGPAGIGKSRLLAVAAAMATAAGMLVLGARGSELEHAYPFGVVLQLLEAVIAGASDRESLLSGAAALAAPLFGRRGREGRVTRDDPGFSLIHGLYWVLSNLAHRRPATLLIDDAHWADAPSMRFVRYVARRLEDLPVALVVTIRTDEPGTDATLARQVEAEGGAASLRPAPLSRAATTQLVRASAPGASPAFCAAAHRVTGGNPFLLSELLREWSSSGDLADDAAAERLGEVAPSTVALAALGLIARLPSDGVALARAVTVLGDGAPLRHAARVAGVSVEEGARIADALRAGEILAPGADALCFVHPLIRTAVYQEIPDGERAQAHLAAARILLEEGVAADRVASHLLLSPRQGQEWVVEVLETAARSAGERGAPESSAALLRRALEEPPRQEERARLLVELGKAESAAGDPRFARRFTEAAELVDDRRGKAEAMFLLGRRLYGTGHYKDAAEAFERGLGSLDGADDELRDRLEAGFVAAGRLVVDTRPRALERMESLRRRAPAAGNVMERVVAGSLAFELAVGGAPREEVVELARRALDGDVLLSETATDGLAFYSACAALGYADELDRAEAALDAALDRARRVGSAPMFARASAFRAFVLYRKGRIDDAIADAASALDGARDGTNAGGPAVNAVLGEALLDRGDVEAAERALELPDGGEGWHGTAPWAYYLHLRGRLHLVRRDAAAALGEFLACGELLERLQALNPSLVPWRASGALAALRLGDRERARSLAAAGVDRAGRFGAPRALGLALRSQGLVTGGPTGLDFLRQAVTALESSPAQVELARALADLGAATRRAGRRREAREPLRRALDLAHRCGARAIADRAREELVAAGGRPRRSELSGRHALTPSERRVAEMAARGLTNRQIAEALFVTVKTVQYHLGNVYRKLDVDSRERLAGALEQELPGR